MEMLLTVIGIMILIGVVGAVFSLIGSIFKWLLNHVLVTTCLIAAVWAYVSGDESLAVVIVICIPPILIVGWILTQIRVRIWLEYPAFGEAEDFPGGERSLDKELDAGRIKRIGSYVVSAPFIEKHYAEYKALLDLQGAATPEQFVEACGKDSELIPVRNENSKILVRAVLNDMVSKGDAKEVGLDEKQAISEKTGNPLFISEHPAMNSNFVRREISLD